MNRNPRRLSVTLLAVLVLLGPGAVAHRASAGQPAVEASLPPLPPRAQRLERALRSVHSLRAEVIQSRHVMLSGEELMAQGVLAFRPPTDFRLAFTLPEPQELVIRGDSLWVVMPVENQAQRYPFSPDAPGNEIFLLFGGRNGSLAAAFTIVEEPWADRDDALRLFPRNPDPGYPVEEMRLLLNEQDLPEKLFYREISGDTVVLTFLTFDRNPANIEQDLALQLPPGIEVIDASAPDLHDGMGLDKDGDDADTPPEDPR